MKVLLINDEKELPVETFMGRKLSASLEGKLITTSLVAKGEIDKTDKLAVITKVTPQYKKLKNQSSDILQHSQNRPTGDRWLKL